MTYNWMTSNSKRVWPCFASQALNVSRSVYSLVELCFSFRNMPLNRLFSTGMTRFFNKTCMKCCRFWIISYFEFKKVFFFSYFVIWEEMVRSTLWFYPSIVCLSLLFQAQRVHLKAVIHECPISTWKTLTLPYIFYD